VDLAEARVFGRALGAIARLQAGLTPEQQEWLGAVPVARALEAIDAMPEGTDVLETAAEVEAIDATVGVECDPEWTGPYWNLVLLHMVARRLERGWSFELPPAVHRSLLVELTRVVAKCETSPPRPDALGDGGFMTDLGFARGIAVSFGFGLFVLPVWLPEGAGDDRPWIIVHLNGSQAQDVSDWNAWMEQIPPSVEFFRANPEFAGMFGTGWMSDPAVAEMSPHLAFMRQMMLEGGATIVAIGSTDNETIEHATSTSATRRRPYEEGSWTPSDHRLVWARDDFLRWVEGLGITT
jgi:hypothetical protein